MHVVRIKRSRLAAIAACILLLAGCSQRPENLADRDRVELRRVESGLAIRVFLSTEGAARVDLRDDTERLLDLKLRDLKFPGLKPTDQKMQTLLVPVDAQDMKRLATAVNALMDAAAQQTAVSDLPLTSSETITVCCRHDGRDRSIRISRLDMRKNRVWRGVVEEIEAVGQLNLARAIHDHDSARVYLMFGEDGRAFNALERAARELSEWESMFNCRYIDGIWEPGIKEKAYVIAGERMSIGGEPAGPGELVKILKMTRSAAIELARHYWQDYLGYDLSIERAGDVAIVWYSTDLIRATKSRLPVTVAPPLVEALRNLGGNGKTDASRILFDFPRTPPTTQPCI